MMKLLPISAIADNAAVAVTDDATVVESPYAKATADVQTWVNLPLQMRWTPPLLVGSFPTHQSHCCKISSHHHDVDEAAVADGPPLLKPPC